MGWFLIHEVSLRGRGDPAEYQLLNRENGDRIRVFAGAACRDMAAVLLPVQ